MEQGILSREGSSVILTNPAFSEHAASADWFESDFWARRQQVSGGASGRGTVVFFEWGGERWALRHYRRGGLVGRLNRDRYLFTGHRRVRAVREFALLRTLTGWGLPTSAPLAARYERSGPWYRADLITRYIPHRQTLAQYLQQLPEASIDAEPAPGGLTAVLSEVGTAVGVFQAAGVCHADLNCHNVLLADTGVHIIDLDRGALLAPGNWQQRAVQRLRRSALKVSPAASQRLLLSCWPTLEDAERAARESPSPGAARGTLGQ